MIRSILLAPPDSEEAVERALAGPADAVAIDLPALPTSSREQGRARARTVLERIGGRASPLVLIVIEHLDAPATRADLMALCPVRPFGLLLRGAGGGADIQQLGAALAVEEAKAGHAEEAFRIVPVAETGSALFGLTGFGAASRRVDALGWDGERLARDLGCERAREENGAWTDPLQTARTLALAAAADAGLPAIDSGLSDASEAAFRREAEAARRDGFRAKLAFTEAQAMIANAVFGASG